MQLRLEQVNSMFIKERELSKKAFEEATQLNKEVPVLFQDTERIDSLTRDVERLQALLLQQNSETCAAQQAFAELQEKNFTLVGQLHVAEKKAEDLQNYALRLEEKLSNAVAQSKVVYQQPVYQVADDISAQPKLSLTPGTQENVITSTMVRHTKSVHILSKPQKALQDKHQEHKDLLLRCISSNFGFSGGMPIAACTIYKFLLHWESFELEKTCIFDTIIHKMESKVEVSENYMALSYWLSNISTLLLLLQHTLKASASSRRHTRRSATSMFGTSPRGHHRSHDSCENLSDEYNCSHQVEAKYPALMFKQQLTALVEKIYRMLRDDVKKEISPLLASCIQAPRELGGILTKGPRAQENAVTQCALDAHWQSIVKCLDGFLGIMKVNHVPPFFVRKLFMQVFSFIDMQLFNSLLLRRECCSFSNGEYVKGGLSELEQWCNHATELYTGLAFEELRHIKQAVAFLVLHQKSRKSFDEIAKHLCPELSMQQLYRISSMYCDDKYGNQSSLSANVIMQMRSEMMLESSGTINRTFLLEDDSSISFSVDDISNSGASLDISHVEPPFLLPFKMQDSHSHSRA